MKIIPAILAKTPEEFETMVREVEPYTDLVHLDIADEGFVPNKTIDGFKELEKINTKLNFEVHLMVNNPENIIDNWLNTKASRFLVHAEAVSDFDFLINKINMAGREVGCVFNPKTGFSVIDSYVHRINVFQFMTVVPGFYGSPFLPEVLDKIRDFHIRYPDKLIQVDGGMNPETIKLVETSGATSAAVGSYIFQSNNVKEALESL
ncbi:MAG: ribulose-phosphate 3-epimerase [Parcubacteria group bacterium Gr01-1014_2]|nr:MAG: ribulose-phosphate 3-epimerase [Parcubacteria group bacterium Gr01-1014_2]